MNAVDFQRWVGIVSAADRDAANNALAALGYGPDNFSMALIAVLSASDAPAVDYLTDWGGGDETEWAARKAAVAHLDVTWHDEGLLVDRREDKDKGLSPLLGRRNQKPKLTST
jgi:hypothetical protein